jgi:hypothetical protein
MRQNWIYRRDGAGDKKRAHEFPRALCFRLAAFYIEAKNAAVFSINKLTSSIMPKAFTEDTPVAV